jgi:DamX protein
MNSATPDYLEAYSLGCAPFETSLDERFFYGGTALMQRLDLLTHLTQFGDSVILVAGPEGSGKTTMLSRFISQANSQWLLCLIGVDEFADLPARIAETLDCDENDDISGMLAQWAAQSEPGQLLVFVVDDAELLEQNAFIQLCRMLDQPFRERIRLILFGQPETQDRLKKVLQEKGISCTTQFLEVPRLSEEETASYLMYRLAVAGYSGESPFTSTEIRGICKAADGRPGTTNQLAHAALVEHHARAKTKRPRTVSRQSREGRPWFWGFATVALLSATLYLAWQRLGPEIQVGGDSSLASHAPGIGVITPPFPDATGLSSHESEATTQLAMSRTEPQPPARPDPGGLAEGAKHGESPTPTASIAATAGAANGRERSAAGKPGAHAPESATPVELATDGDGAPQAVPAAATQAARAADGANAGSAARPPPPSEPAAQTTATAEATVDIALDSLAREPAVGEKTMSKQSVEAASAGASNHLPHREEWLLQQPEDAFTLQLLGSRSEKSIRDFIRQNRLDPQQAAYYRGYYRDAEWYVLLHGIYSSRTSALNARDRLPQRVRKDKPWPRSMTSVHQSIREMESDR